MKSFVRILICFSFPSLIFTFQDIKFPTSIVKYCKSSSGEEGQCLSLSECSKVLQGLRNGFLPISCGFSENDPLVCCPSKLENSTNGLSERISQNEVTSPTINFKCGSRSIIKILRNNGQNVFAVRRKRSRLYQRTIAGGITAFRNSWPWMVLLGRKEGGKDRFFCSAVLINNNYIVTAAHCLLSTGSLFARLGEHDFMENSLREVENIETDSILIHPKYESGKGYYDVALIKLAKAVNFTNEVSPICLPWDKLAIEDLVNETVVVAGWGTLSYGGKQSSVLQEVNVTVFNPSVCDESYSTLRDYKTSFPQGLTTENIVCAGDVDGVKDACQGDSGGPLMHYNIESKSYILEAIVSKGFGCGLKDFPGLYSPVRNTETLQWIKDTAFSEE